MGLGPFRNGRHWPITPPPTAEQEEKRRRELSELLARRRASDEATRHGVVVQTLTLAEYRDFPYRTGK